MRPARTPTWPLLGTLPTLAALLTLLLLMMAPAARAQAGECADAHAHCLFWAAKGECAANPDWMRPNCARACGACRPTSSTAAPPPPDVTFVPPLNGAGGPANSDPPPSPAPFDPDCPQPQLAESECTAQVEDHRPVPHPFI